MTAVRRWAVLCACLAFLVGLLLQAKKMMRTMSSSCTGGYDHHEKEIDHATYKSSSSLSDALTYTQLQDAVTAKFPTVGDKSRKESFKESLELMLLSETDGEPIAIKAYPHLHVGSGAVAYNLEALEKAEITHIVNLSPSVKNCYPQNFSYLHVTKIHDRTNSANRIGPLFEKTTQFIEEARNAGGNILVHCWKGQSRSVSIIIAYLIRYQGLTRDEALKEIRQTRPQAKPNRQYMTELLKYQEKIRQIQDGDWTVRN